MIFPADGARSYLRDLPDAELHLLDTGHFALEDQGDDIATLMLDFLDRKLPRKCLLITTSASRRVLKSCRENPHSPTSTV